MRLVARAVLGLCLLLTLAACELQPTPIQNYEQARSVFWQSLYPNKVQSLYCGEEFFSDQRRGYNVEHVFPMSWVTNALNCGTRKQCRNHSPQFNLIEADLHNLYPARVDVNKARSSFRFGQLRGEPREFGASCDFEVSSRARIVEPAAEVRGEVARAMFYMADRYKAQGLRIFRAQAQLLAQWHESDPPSAQEIKRNDRIEALQGNRNRFVDQPDELGRLLRAGHFE